ncbi:MAG: hypothetical protein KGJ23_00795 [Euryarchaeota archaeon]|nr:hypothetical protein [Euryarchaeota archaeon]MDE1835133.1 hypothetical protein [Euryarchaeota archaeon]MDE1881890.1 hypothetical protein [Euryarchaeota archaeon]MDE2044904.1 hypothetical protein [Thermoplasmata archaeon]
MAKRRPVRPQGAAEVEEKEIAESPEERRARRQRERRARQKQATRHGGGILATWPLWKSIGVFGGTAGAVIAAVAVIVLFLPHPCLGISAPPSGSGVPDESAPSWCVNNSVSLDERMAVSITIVLGGIHVGIPGGIGEINQHKWGWTCTMPVFTDNSSGSGSGDSGGVVQIASPWNFTYTLGDFFNMWKESYGTVSINGNSETVDYTNTQLFNYTSNANQVVRLWVDGQVSDQGPGLVLNYLADDYQTSSEVPQCFVQQYHSGHTIFLTWGWVGAGMGVGGPTLFQTAGATMSGPIVGGEDLPLSHEAALVNAAPVGVLAFSASTAAFVVLARPRDPRPR